MDASKALEVLEIGVATGIASLTLTRSSLFSPARVWIKKRSEWWGELTSCPYCMAHWIAALLVGLAWPGWHQALYNWLAAVAIAIPVAAIVYFATLTILPSQRDLQALEVESLAQEQVTNNGRHQAAA